MISCYASNEKITITPFRDALLAGEFSCLHIGGYFNCIGCHTSEFLDVIDALKANGTLISMDPQHDANEKWTGEDGHLKQLLPKLDVFMPNEVEIVRTADVNLPRASSEAPRTPEEALEALAAEYPTLSHRAHPWRERPPRRAWADGTLDESSRAGCQICGCDGGGRRVPPAFSHTT